MRIISIMQYIPTPLLSYQQTYNIVKTQCDKRKSTLFKVSNTYIKHIEYNYEHIYCDILDIVDEDFGYIYNHKYVDNDDRQLTIVDMINSHSRVKHYEYPNEGILYDTLKKIIPIFNSKFFEYSIEIEICDMTYDILMNMYYTYNNEITEILLKYIIGDNISIIRDFLK